jgi:transcriptional regulator of aromatic amino acid metabolism
MFLAIMLFVAFYLKLPPSFLGEANPVLYLTISLLYLLIAVVWLILNFNKWGYFTSQTQIQLISDIVFITLLVHISCGLQTGLGTLLVIVAGGALTPGRISLFIACTLIELAVPPLRERQADIVLLAKHILQQVAKKNAIMSLTLNEQAISALNGYAFTGNVRELENILERALTWAEGTVIIQQDLMLPVQFSPTSEVRNQLADRVLSVDNDLESKLEEQERELITQALESTRWNKTAAAKRLGITFRALRYKLKKLNLE